MNVELAAHVHVFCGCPHSLHNELNTSSSQLDVQDRGTSLASNQVQYSLLYRAPERNGVKQACEEGGTSLIAYSPLAQGLLTGDLRLDDHPVLHAPGAPYHCVHSSAVGFL